MGADNFTATALGKTAGDAFRSAVEHAQWEDGHGGYTGTIAEKHSYVPFNLPARMSAAKFEQTISEALRLSEVSYLREEVRYARTATERKRAERDVAKAERKLAAFRTKLGPQVAALIDRAAAVYDDKWGPAVCVEVTGKQAREYKARVGRAGTRDKVFVFMGMASS
jgi:hypothetical protein